MTPQKRHFTHQDETQFKPGNQAAVKPKWTAKRLTTFAQDLHAFRVLIGYNYSEMGRALGSVTGQYCKMLERGERQPSAKIVRIFKRLKAAPILNGERPSGEALDHLAEIWTHVLGKRFKCPECVKLVKRGELHKGLEFWWSASPNQKHCPTHQRKRTPRTRPARTAAHDRRARAKRAAGSARPAPRQAKTSKRGKA